MSRAYDLRYELECMDENIACVESDLAMAEEDGDEEAADAAFAELDTLLCYRSDLDSELRELEGG